MPCAPPTIILEDRHVPTCPVLYKSDVCGYRKDTGRCLKMGVVSTRPTTLDTSSKYRSAEVVAKLSPTAWVAQAIQRFVFDLPDPLTGQPELLPHLFQSVAPSILQTKAQP